ncbi:MAG TPA: phytanoyl-CoA dioxygenase family protein [Acidimicrobiales bacterium]|nr:phytanoyl-CoA dioxygenase family protein [Acidimicrobiales bacterium]
MTDTPAATRLHPWNTGFTWADRPGPFRTLSAAQVAHFDAQGYVVLPSLVDDETLARVRAETDRFEDEVAAFLESVDGGRIAIAEAGAITFTTHLVARSEVLRALSLHPTIAGICADLVGRDVNLYWDQAVYKKPEKPRRFPWHQDNGYAFVEPQQYLTVWLALTDATLANGCPMVAPGFHRLGTIAHTYVDPLGWECLRDPDGVVAAEIPAGGAVVFSSLTPHLTGPNTTDEVRKAYILQYAPAGAEILRGDPHAGPPAGRDACDAPERQYPVVVGGAPVSARR